MLCHSLQTQNAPSLGVLTEIPLNSWSQKHWWRIWGEKNLHTVYLEQEKVLCREARSAEIFHHCTQKQKSKFYQIHKLSATYILVPDAESIISGGNNYLILCMKWNVTWMKWGFSWVFSLFNPLNFRNLKRQMVILNTCFATI